MAIKLINLFVDSVTNEPIELITCSCGNNVFYISVNNEKMCSCCNASESEQLLMKDNIESKKG